MKRKFTYLSALWVAKLIYHLATEVVYYLDVHKNFVVSSKVLLLLEIFDFTLILAIFVFVAASFVLQSPFWFERQARSIVNVIVGWSGLVLIATFVLFLVIAALKLDIIDVLWYSTMPGK